MEAPETDILSFIVRIWLEEAAEDPEQAVWRGQITSVPDGQRRYVQRLDEITDFIKLYLDRLANTEPDSEGKRP